jgi:serine/threonine-protein phosphatase PGAM5
VPHHLYLVRHGEQQDAEHGVEDGPLSARGVRQAHLIAERLSGVAFTEAFHSPLVRGEDTARVMRERLPATPFAPHALLMDCIPSGLEAEPPAAYRSFFTGVSDAEVEAGRAQMADAVDQWLTPRGERSDVLLLTHNFVIGWFVRHVLDAPDWKWMSLNQANAGLTVIHMRPGRPAQLICHNDLGHLPVELRTGMPAQLPV